MCLGVPMQVAEPAGFGAHCRRLLGGDAPPAAECEWVDLSLTGAQPAGTLVLVHAGLAREVLVPARAYAIADALRALEAAVNGESLEGLFADLEGREPELPEHLRQASEG